MILSLFKLEGCPVCSINYGKGTQIPIFSTKQKRKKKGKEDEVRQSLSNGSQPRDVHVLALDEIEDSVLHPCEVCMLQKIEAAGNGTVPAAAESRWQPHDHERSKPNQRDVATGFAF